MNKNFVHIALLVAGIALFLLACRTANLIAGMDATPTRERATRASLRPTFTPIPTDTEAPPPTETPEPTEPPPPTDEPPTATRRPTARPVPTKKPPTPTATPRPPTPEPSPTVYYPWTTSGNPSCVGGDNKESSVSGKITANGKAAVGQFVQASSGPGGEPISDVPAQSDSNGNYKVTFICGGNACSGDFWLWMVDASRRQISPFVKFHFDGGCRKGTLNFVKR
jgi:outer membrane biosynthesis protein TonB